LAQNPHLSNQKLSNLTELSQLLKEDYANVWKVAFRPLEGLENLKTGEKYWEKN
jgi:hypothetical protein